jgi:lipopolysaccharide export system protein LptA
MTPSHPLTRTAPAPPAAHADLLSYVWITWTSCTTRTAGAALRAIRTLCTATAAALALGLAAISGAALAEKADKDKPAVITADKASTNEVTQTSLIEGNVIISKGSIVITASRAEVKRDAQGYQIIIATGTAAKPASFKQKREGLNETIEAQALRLDFDGKSDTIVLTDQAVVRRVAAGVAQDEVRGATIKYFNQAEIYEVNGGPSSSQAGGRIQMVLSPRVSPASSPATGDTPATAAPK